MKTISEMTYDEYQALLKTCDIYERCRRCGKATEGITRYCLACQTATGEGDRPTWGGVEIDPEVVRYRISFAGGRPVRVERVEEKPVRVRVNFEGGQAVRVKIDFGNTPMAERGTAINTAKPEGRR